MKEHSSLEDQYLVKAIGQSRSAVLVTDADGTIVYANPYLAELTAYTQDELIGNNPRILQSGTTPREDYERLWKLIKSGKEWRGEFCNRKKSGEIYWISASIAPVKNATGTITHFISIQEDITRQKRIEIERKVLLEITQGSASTEKLVDFIGQVHQALKKAIYAENFFVVLFNPKSGLFEEVYSVDQCDPVFVPFELGKSVSAYVFRTAQPLLLTQEHFEELVEQQEVELVGTNSPSWMGIPLTVYGKTIGVMVVQDYEKAERYSESDKEMLASIAGQIALAIQRKLAEQALWESEARFRLLAEYSTDMISRHDPEGAFLYVSPACHSLLGYRPEELVGRSAFDFLHSEDIPSLQYTSEFFREHHSAYTISFRMRTKDGTYAWLETTSRGIVDPITGILVEIHAATRDISARVLAQMALQESEARLRSVVDAAPYGAHLYTLELDGRLVFSGANQSANRILGMDQQQFIGKTIEEAFPPLVQTAIPDAYRNVALHGESFEMDQVDYDDAEIRGAFEIHAFQTGVRQMAVFFRDITERKRAEDALLNQLAFDEMMTRLLARFANSSGNDINLVIEDALGEVARFIGGDHAYVLLETQSDPSWITSHQWRNGGPTTNSHPFMNSTGGLPPWSKQKIRSGEVICISTIDDLPVEAIEERQNILEEGARSVLQVPLCGPSKRVSGCLGIDSRIREISWSDRDLSRLKMVGDAIANLLERQHVEISLAQQIEHLSALRSIDQAIITSSDLIATLRLLAYQALEQLHVDAACILLFNSSSQTLSFASGLGFRTSALQPERLAIGSSLAGLAALQRRAIYIPNFSEVALEPALAASIKTEGLVAYYCVPLSVKDQLHGVLEIFQRTPLYPDPEWLSFLETLASQAAIVIDNSILLTNLQRSNLELEKAYDRTLEGWSRALDMRDKETEGHTRRVTELTLQLAGRFGLTNEQILHIRRGCLLHDIGKMGIPDSILLKPGELNAEEWVIMRKHPIYAYEMMSPIQYLQPALEIPLHHHERWNGSGYPFGLRDSQIPLAARIFAVVDVWDAVTSDRPYRTAWSRDAARNYIRENAGIMFDPQVVVVFLKICDSL